MKIFTERNFFKYMGEIKISRKSGNGGKKVLHTEIITESCEWVVPDDVNEVDVMLFGGGGGGKTVTYSSATYYTPTIDGGTTSFGTYLSADGGQGSQSSRGGSGGSGGGGGASQTSDSNPISGGNGSYGGGGGGGGGNSNAYSSVYAYGGNGGNGGIYGGGGGGGSAAGQNGLLPGKGGKGNYGNGGDAGESYEGTYGTLFSSFPGSDGSNGFNTTMLDLDFVGNGLGGKGGANSSDKGLWGCSGGAGGGGGGYGGNGGNGGDSVKYTYEGPGCGGGGGGGYGADGGNGASGTSSSNNNSYAFGGGGGGGGGYGGRGGDSIWQSTGNSTGGGGGGGYGLNGKGGDGYVYSDSYNSDELKRYKINQAKTNGGIAAGGGGTGGYGGGGGGHMAHGIVQVEKEEVIPIIIGEGGGKTINIVSTYYALASQWGGDGIAILKYYSSTKRNDKQKYNSNNKIYSIQINQNNSDPLACCTYADDAVGMEKGSNNWDKIFGYKPCIMQNGTVIGYLDPDDFSKYEDGSNAPITDSNYDVMIEFPRRGINITTDDNNVITVSLTTDPDNSNFQYKAFSYSSNYPTNYFYLGAYSGIVSSSKLYSYSGGIPTGNDTIANLYKYSYSGRTTGYSITGFFQWTYIQVLYLLKYGNLDCKVALGQGYTGGSSPQVTGVTNSRGMCYGNPNSTVDRVKLFGLEDWWGNMQQYISNIYCDASYNILTCAGRAGVETASKYYDNTISTGLSNNTNNSNIIKVQGTNEGGFIPKEIGNNLSATNINFCGMGYICKSSFMHAGGGYWDTNYSGIFTTWLDWTSTSTHVGVGARLMYLYQK